MVNVIFKLLTFIGITFLLSGCATDLSSDTYSSSSTLSLTLEGVVVSARPITIKEHTNPSENVAGTLAGGALGAAIGSNIGGGGGRTVATAGGAIAGALAGNAIQGKLQTSKGFEYIVKVDPRQIKDTPIGATPAMRSAISSATTNGLITVVQSTKQPIGEGQRVYVIYSDSRTRIVAAR